MELTGADFGLPAFPLTLKLELFQHAGSFKTRGAFANLLTRPIPAAGVVAASGGNHGAAVAYAALRLRVPAHIFLPTVSSPAKIRRTRACGADPLGTRRGGELMWPMARADGARVVLVADAAIRCAQEALWDGPRLGAEPGGVAAFSALVGAAYVPAPGERVGVLVSGGNTTAVDFGR